jgi:hypothetical protein
MSRIVHVDGTCTLCTSGMGHPDGVDYGSIAPLCDVRGCQEPQSGEILELAVEGWPPCWVRVDVCVGHKDRLTRRIRRDAPQTT